MKNNQISTVKDPKPKKTLKEGGVTGKGWKPGQSGNPNGRPKKGTAISDILNNEGNKIDKTTGKSHREIMLENVYAQAVKDTPDKWAVEFIANRTEGKAIERSADVSEEWKELLTELYSSE